MLNNDTLLHMSKFLTIPDMYTFFSVNKNLYDRGTELISLRCGANGCTRSDIKRFYIHFQKYIEQWRMKRIAVPLWMKRRNDDTPILLF
jgi:hypothetical protein